ncbi:MAG TPA: PAS domain-containing sensor histidine kinase [Verrucomicrobiae bacterium]|nr:PAS domain-containing sensor histidine kinase [Verrucomicrobiae bacterium]
MSRVEKKTIKRVSPRERAALRPPSNARAVRTTKRNAPAWGLSSSAAYQRRICELELELSTLHQDLEELRSKAVVTEISRRHYAELYQNAPVGYLTMDDLGRIIECNATFLELAGLPGQAGEQQLYFGRLVAPGYVPRFLEHLHLAQRSTVPVSSELYLRAENETVPVQLISGSQIKSGAAARLVQTIVLDFTRQASAEQARPKTQSDFKALVDTVQGVVWEANPNSLELTYVSSRCAQVLGYPPTYWTKGVGWESHVHREDRERMLQAMRLAAEERTDLTMECRMITADRRVIWVQNSMSAAVLGRRLRLFGVLTDITDRKLAEEQLRQARDELEQRVNQRTSQLRETVRDLESFSYSLSHDLRAPLRAMQGYAQLLMNRLANVLDEPARTYFQRLIASSERLDHLIQDVLKFSRVSRGPVEVKPLNLEDLLVQVINDYPVLLPPKVRIEVQQPLLGVCGHEAFLTQCLSNLLSNAVKFHRPGETPHVKISTQRIDGGNVRIWFEDNGIGIAPEDQRRIFGIFERVHSGEQYEGTGIGLAIVAKAVERMGGHVGVESTPGRGSRFWLELPGVKP